MDGMPSSGCIHSDDELERNYGFKIKAAFGRESREWPDLVYGNKDKWRTGGGADEYTLGSVFLYDVDQGRREEYFRDSSEATALLESIFPGLHRKVLDFTSRIVGAPVTYREGWSGPSFVVFGSDSECASLGGAIHIDSDGFPDENFYRDELRGKNYSIVVMLQKPSRGGGLFLWDAVFDPKHACDYLTSDGEMTSPRSESIHVSSEPGDVVVFPAFRVHQIEPFKGFGDRITLTYHLAEIQGIWKIWF